MMAAVHIAAGQQPKVVRTLTCQSACVSGSIVAHNAKTGTAALVL
jgi:hypothetical protein